MVIIHVGNGEYIGAAADTKPVSGITANSILRLDDGGVFRFGNSGWGFIGNVSGQFNLQSGSTIITSTISGGIFNSPVYENSFTFGSTVSGVTFSGMQKLPETDMG